MEVKMVHSIYRSYLEYGKALAKEEENRKLDSGDSSNSNNNISFGGEDLMDEIEDMIT